jgi:ABC-type transport system involved in cytochrome c biogenesis ATPase subunit
VSVAAPPERPLADERPQIPRPPSEPAVVVEHLARRFGGRLVLQDVSFTVPSGVAFGIAGANGSGKTVLLRLLATLDRPTTGRIVIHGYDSVRRARAVRDRIGYVPEEPMLYDGITAEQYLQFVGRARGLGKQVRQVAVDTLLQVVGLDDRSWRDVSSFSPGERRRLALAGALVHEPGCCWTIRCAVWMASPGSNRSKCCASCIDWARPWSSAVRGPRISSKHATCWRSCATGCSSGMAIR